MSRHRVLRILGPLAVVIVAAAVVVVVLTAADGSHKASGSGNRSATLTEEQIVARSRTFVVQIRGIEGSSRVFGSGIVIDSKRGLAVTNAHVVSGLSSMTVRFSDGRTSPARVVGQAPCDDVAVISITNMPSGAATQAQFSTQPLAAGQHVTALGYPASLANLMTEDVNSSDGSVSVPIESAAPDPSLPRYSSVIQHTATINPGNSGGPLIDDVGKVVGMNTLGNTSENDRVIQGQYYAVSTEQIESDLHSLETGHNKSYVGWTLVPLGAAFTASFVRDLQSRRVGGLIVTGLDPGSVASRDFSTGDVVGTIDGTPVNTVPEVCAILNSHGPGDTLSVDGTNISSGQQVTLTPFSRTVALP